MPENDLKELDALQTRLNSLAASLSPADRRTFLRGIGTYIRRSQMQRIGQQKNPDGTKYTPRARPKKPLIGLRAIHFLYPSGGSGAPRAVFMKSWRYEGKRYLIGWDTEAGGERTFDRSKIIRRLPVDPSLQNKNAGKLRPVSRREKMMFRKLRGPRFLRYHLTPDELSVGFAGRTGEIAHAHQYGDDTRPARELIGLSDDDMQHILDEAYRLVDEAFD